MNKNRRKKIGIILIATGGVSLLVIVFFVFFGNKLILNPQYEFEAEQTVVQTSKELGFDSISIPGMDSITVQSGTKNVSVDLYNPESNKCYFEISILLSGNTEIYKSKLLKPGQHLYKIELSKALEKGSYDATLHYNTYTTDGDYTPLNGANVPIKLIAK